MGIYIIMCKKIYPTNNRINFDVVKFFDKDDDGRLYVVLPDTVSPDVIPFLKFLCPDYTDVIYVKSDLTCPGCGSPLKMSTSEEIHPNKLDNVIRMVYRCSNRCSNKRYRAKLDNFIPDGCNYTKNMQMITSRLKYVEEVPYRKLDEIFMGIFGFRIPKSTLYDHYDKNIDDLIESVDEEIDEMIEKENIECSGVFNYDEQFPKIMKQEKVRLTILDANTYYAHPMLLIDGDDFDSDIVCRYWHDIIDDLPHEAMVTDGHAMYPPLFKEFNMEHALCVFHAIYNVRDKPYKVINSNNKQIKNKIKKIDKIEKDLVELNKKYHPKRGRISKLDNERRSLHDKIKSKNKTISKLNKKISKLNHENEEIAMYMDRISLIFKSKKFTTAENRLNRLLEIKDKIPEVLVDSLSNLKRKFDKLTKHIENDKIPNTNNWIELFFKLTCPGKLKKYYKTDKGLDRKTRINRSRWNLRN